MLKGKDGVFWKELLFLGPKVSENGTHLVKIEKKILKNAGHLSGFCQKNHKALKSINNIEPVVQHINSIYKIN